ncbi:MAG TPA: Gfo/Idh/MocA family oxidoreductase, partial [Bacteroidia bacterium]|nr:Gfo/Idh/MocA family oxidoreductase [Bacteroidia bacterium]
MNKNVKFAVIGQGHIGKRHAEMIRRGTDTELVAVCDVLPKSALGLDALKEPFYSSIEELLKAHPEVEVLNICTPNGFHAAHSLLGLEQGKHVVCEKPMALHRKDCEAVIYKALQMHKQVFCVMQNRFSPPSEWLKKVVSEKIIGDVFMAQLNCYWNRDERYYKKGGWKGSQELDGGTLFTQFSHFIDILYWLFGDITDIQAKFNDFVHEGYTEFEDSGLVNFRFVNGGMGCINYSTAV